MAGAKTSGRAALLVPLLLAPLLLSLAGPATAQPAHCQNAAYDEVTLWAPAARIAWLTEELAACPGPEAQALAYYSRGKAYIDLREYAAAVADLSQSIALQPPDVFYDYAARAFAYLKLRQPEAAIADATAALEYEPFFAHAYNTRGIASCDLHRLSDGREDLLTAIELDRDLGRAWQDFLRREGYYEGAVGGSFNAASKVALAQWCKTHRIASGPELG
jgi:tetratricopeptide (TPR) repeat protein